MTGVDIAASVSEAGGESPLPTGAVEMSEDSSAAVAGSFSEALAAQTDEGQRVPVFGSTPDRPPLADGEPNGEGSESEPMFTEIAGVISDSQAPDPSLSLEDGIADVLLTAVVGDNADNVEQTTAGLPEATAGRIENILPTDVYWAAETVNPDPTVRNGVEDRGLKSETQVAPGRPTPIDPVAPRAGLSPPGVTVEGTPMEGTVLAHQPGVSGSAQEIVKLPAPDAEVVRVPSHTNSDDGRLEPVTESLDKNPTDKNPTNASEVDIDAGPDVPATQPRRIGTTGTQLSDPVRPTAVAQPRILTEPQKSDTSPIHADLLAEPATPGDQKSATSPTTAAVAVGSDADTSGTVLDEKTKLGPFFGRAEAPVGAKTRPSVAPVGTRQATPIMVELPVADGASTHPVVPLPGAIGTDPAVTQQVSVLTGMGPAEAWRYEEVARLLEDSGHVVQQTRASVTASTVMPLEALSEWTGAAVRSSFASTVLSDPEQLELPDQLVRGIRMQWRNGVGEAKLRLTPEHLGEVFVSLHVRQGSVSAVLRADSDIVRDWIRAHQHELKSSLEAQGLQLDELVVEEDGHADREPPGREFDRPRRRPPRQTSEARFEVRV